MKRTSNLICLMLVILLKMILLIPSLSKAQADSDISGEYFLKGMPEVAAGFKIDKDGTFIFQYVYGAADRSAQGTYKVDNDKLILKGTKSAGNDFQIINKKRSGDDITIQIIDSNKLLINDVACFFVNKNSHTILVKTDTDGKAVSTMDDCREIHLIHIFFPDKPTIIDLTNNENNFFEFSLSPSLEEVVFDNDVIIIDSDDKNIVYYDNIYLFSQKARFIKENTY